MYKYVILNDEDKNLGYLELEKPIEENDWDYNQGAYVVFFEGQQFLAKDFIEVSGLVEKKPRD